MKTLYFSLLIGAALLTGNIHAQSSYGYEAEALFAMNSGTESTNKYSGPTSIGDTFVAVETDHFSQDAFLGFSSDLIGADFQVINEYGDIWLTKNIVSTGMGVDTSPLPQGNYIISVNSRWGRLSSEFQVD